MSMPHPPAAKSDVALMQLVASGDTRAQRELVERFSARVRRVSRLLAAHGTDPEDAAQLSLLEVLNSADRFRVATSLDRWVDRITVRTTLRLARRERTRRHLLMRWLLPETLPWGTRAESSQSERKGALDLLDRLTPSRREALVLRHVFEYTVEEVAELTGVPVGTVKDRLVAARKQLRKALELEARAGRLR